MTTRTTIGKRDLLTVVERVRARIDELEEDDVVLGVKDYYWKLPMRDATELPTIDDVTTGSIRDDVESLMALVNDPERSVTSVDLDRLASVLRALSTSWAGT